MSTATIEQPTMTTTPETPAAPTPAVAPAVTPSPAAVTPAVVGDAAAAPGETPQAAPVEYALTLPQDSLLDPTAVERVTAFAKAEHLAPASAQKVLELAHAESTALVEKQKADYTTKINGWEAAVKADPELGGANEARTALRAKAVLEKYGNPELMAALKATGFGNYPALVRFVDKIGAAMANDNPVNGNPPSQPAQKTDAQAIYPNMNP